MARIAETLSPIMNGVRLGPINTNPPPDALREVCVFGQKACGWTATASVTSAALTLRDAEVAIHRGRRADAYGLISQSNMLEVTVGFRVNRKRSDASLGKPEGFVGGFRLISDDGFFEHRLLRSACYRMIISACPYSTGAPFSTNSHDAAAVSFNLIKDFHRLDDANRLAFAHSAVDVPNGRAPGEDAR